MIEITNTTIVGRFNLIDTEKQGDDRYIRQLSLVEVQYLGKSILDLIEE